jgi:hypothetical protein
MKHVIPGIPEAMCNATLENHCFTFLCILFWLTLDLISQAAFYNSENFVLQPMGMHNWAIARGHKVFCNNPVAIFSFLNSFEYDRFTNAIFDGVRISDSHNTVFASEDSRGAYYSKVRKDLLQIVSDELSKEADKLVY